MPAQPTTEVVATEPLLASVKVAQRMLGDPSLSFIYNLLNTGELQSFLSGRRRLITIASINSYIERRLAESKEFVRARHAAQHVKEHRERRIVSAPEPAA
jgi:hypothetical protein